MTLGIPFSRWGAKPFVVRPLPFPTRILEALAPVTERRSQAQEPRMHPFLLAKLWRQQMERDANLPLGVDCDGLAYAIKTLAALADLRQRL